MQIPFTTLELHLKQVRFNDLHAVEKQTLSFFFPGYASKGFSRKEIKEGLLKPAQEKGLEVLQDDTLPRRFAGDHTLPRSRYYTLCRNDTGDDGGTLVNELRAYSKPDESGYVLMIDSTGTDSEAARARSMLQPHAKAIFCVPQDTPAFPSPFATLVGLDRQKQTGLLIGVIPVVVEQQRIEKVIDLRQPETQRWFTSTLTRLHDPATRQPCFPLAGQLTDFTRLLPALLSQSLGDNRRVTQIAGAWLRHLGTNAVIFPSVRSNAMTRFENGTLVDFAGWNLVDYRDAPKPQIAGAVDLSPEWEAFPLFGGGLPLTDGGTPPIVYDRTRITQQTEGTEQGSLSIEGIKEQREPYYQLGIWMHFAERMGEKHPEVEMPKIQQLLVEISTTPEGLDMGRLALLASFFCGTVFGATQPRQSVINLIRQLQDRGQGERAVPLTRFVRLCDALTPPVQPQ